MDAFLESFDNFKELKNEKVIAVAVSGGIDSLALTFLANEWAKKNKKKIVALTVDHHLRKSSYDEASYVNDLLRKNEIEHHILNWNGDKPKSNIENLAREARYSIICEFCRENKIKVIFLGHHLQDQAENFLIRLFRGSGITGLSSIKKITTRGDFILIRPFLYIEKRALSDFLLEKNIKWVEDESNEDEKYLRNKIRSFLNTFQDKSHIINRINSSVEFFKLAENIIENKVNEVENVVYFFNKEYYYYVIKFDKFFTLEKELQIRIILKVAKKISENIENPRFSKLERLLENLKNLKKYTFFGCIFEKINDNEFVCYKEYNSLKNKEKYIKKGDLNQYFKYLRENDYSKYKKIKDFRGYKKEILYTLIKNDFLKK